MSYSKYYLYKKQYSNDSGVTWYDVTPLEQVASGDPIATYDTLQECNGEVVHVTGVTIVDSSPISILENNTRQLTEVVHPVDATNQSVIWSTSDSSIATVSSGGVVSAVSEGNCTITVTTVDGGYTAQCVVYVETRNYFTIVANSSSSIKRVGNSEAIQYSKNGGSWTTFTSADTVSLASGDKLRLKGEAYEGYIPGGPGVGTFSASTGSFSVSGNVMSLMYNDNFVGYGLHGNGSAFERLFYGCTGLTSAENLVLPAKELADACYYGMFSGCTSLTTAPRVLPATTLNSTLSNGYNCYAYMFAGCTSLTTAPAISATTLKNYCCNEMFADCTSLTSAPTLPATTLAENCYRGMFAGCTSLTTAPSLPATTAPKLCYHSMFSGCTSLTTAPTLPATTLASSCYLRMFQGCTSLTTAPTLPATTLATYCYQFMFQGCTSLTTAPSLPATTLATYCYSCMFSGCTSLTTAPELSAATLVKECYREMFNRCSSLNAITCLATDISAENCTYSWLYNVASSGTFTKASSMNSWTTGNSGIPSNWTVQNA